MPRCPYCDNEYTLGEIYCKECAAELPPEDVPVSEPPEMPEILSPTPSAPEPITELPPIGPCPPSPLGVQPDSIEPQVTDTQQVGPVCPHCGQTNEKDSKFCDRCGKPVGTICPSCQGLNRPGAKFCQHCGSRLSTADGGAQNTGPRVEPEPSAKHYFLVLISQDGKELESFQLREGANQVGAKSAGEGIFPDIDLSSVDTQQVVSRRHAILRVEGDRVTLSDCGSTNGTRVDETKIGTAAVPIFESSNIVFGNLRARLVRR